MRYSVLKKIAIISLFFAVCWGSKNAFSQDLFSFFSEIAVRQANLSATKSMAPPQESPSLGEEIQPLKSEHEPTELHVFIEAYATNPALLQMLQYVQLPRKTRKIIAWHRFPNRAEYIDLISNNTREVPLVAGEGYWVDATLRVLKVTKEELEKDPNLVLVLHANMDKYDNVISYFIKEIPKERIRHIHLYEDGAGELFKRPSTFDPCPPEEFKEIMNNNDKKKHSKPNAMLGLAHFYPTTIYLFGWNAAQTQPQFSKIVKNVEYIDIRDVDFDRYKDTLTEEQKKVFYQLIDFDYDYWASILKNKKTVVFTMGFYFNNKKIEEAERNLLKQLQSDSSLSGINAKEYVWLYKPHPSYSAKGTIPQMRAEFPDMVEIPAQIPFEIFVIADLKPTKTVGYSSSLFYALHEPDILYFVRRSKNDGYLKFLREVRHLPDSKILDLGSFVQK